MLTLAYKEFGFNFIFIGKALTLEMNANELR